MNFETTMVKGLLFDYGGTIDTNGLHWGAVLWEQYQKNRIPVDKASFAKAYSYGERALAIHPLVKPTHRFYDVLLLKIWQQFAFLKQQGCSVDARFAEVIAADCAEFARTTVEKAKPVLNILVEKFPLVMVSNFYGNLEAVLDDFGIKLYFNQIVESAVVGVRKPDPAIYEKGVTALGLAPEECAVIGDSYAKDIVPGKTLGCKTVWLNVEGWDDTPRPTAMSLADWEITDFAQLNTHEIDQL
jgi:FMN hydrolase / 5-amino-6-(5-phospho-D-ribitylamino)uracil phosphatase